MGMFDDERRLKMLASEAVEYGKTSRRSMLAGMGGVVGARPCRISSGRQRGGR